MSEQNQSPFEEAIIELEIKLQILENNAPIHRQEGNIEQADLCDRKIASLRHTLEVLKNAPNEVPLADAPIIRADLSHEQAGQVITRTGGFLLAAGYTAFLSAESTVTAAVAQRLHAPGIIGEGVPGVAIVAVGPQAEDLLAILKLDPFNLNVEYQDVTIVPPPEEAPANSGLIV